METASWITALATLGLLAAASVAGTVAYRALIAGSGPFGPE